MIKNYVLIALRNIRQSPMYAFINIFSLAIGLSACIIIYLFITDERSFDSFHAKKADIYRLDEIQNFTGTNVQNVALSMPGMGPNLLKDFPEIENYTRFMCRPKQLVARDDKQFLLPNVAIVDSTFLDVFDFDVLVGDRSSALDEPNTMMVTQETALRYFTSTDEAMGNSLKYRDKEYSHAVRCSRIHDNDYKREQGVQQQVGKQFSEHIPCPQQEHRHQSARSKVPRFFA
jgi:putative ABC transport system permease protein